MEAMERHRESENGPIEGKGFRRSKGGVSGCIRGMRSGRGDWRVAGHFVATTRHGVHPNMHL